MIESRHHVHLEDIQSKCSNFPFLLPSTLSTSFYGFHIVSFLYMGKNTFGWDNETDDGINGCPLFSERCENQNI